MLLVSFTASASFSFSALSTCTICEAPTRPAGLQYNRETETETETETVTETEIETETETETKQRQRQIDREGGGVTDGRRQRNPNAEIASCDKL